MNSSLSAREAWDIGRLDGHDQAALVASGEVSRTALVEAAIVRIEAVNPALNAVSYRAFEHAMAVAATAEGPMAAVPYLLKASLEYPGFPTQSGSRAKRDVVGKRAFPLAKAFDAAGLVPVGMSAMPEFGLLATNESLLYGPTRNPWAADRTAGGSSSGAAAAVAAGLVPFAQGSDAGGSIRIPASHCGILGFKPSRGWNLRARVENFADDVLCSDGLYGRSARDLRWAARWLRPAGLPREEPAATQRPLRIAISLLGMDGAGPDSDVAEAIAHAAALCAELGHVVEAKEPSLDLAGLLAAKRTLWAYLGGELVDHYRATRPETPIEDLLEPWTLGLAEKRSTLGPQMLADAMGQVGRARDVLVAFHADWDLILSPVARSAAPKLGQLAPTRPFDELWEAAAEHVAYTPIQNIAGAPSLSAPLFQTAAGLPVGAMFSAAPGGDELLLDLAAMLERAQPWADRWPPVTLAKAQLADA